MGFALFVYKASHQLVFSYISEQSRVTSSTPFYYFTLPAPTGHCQLPAEPLKPPGFRTPLRVDAYTASFTNGYQPFMSLVFCNLASTGANTWRFTAMGVSTQPNQEKGILFAPVTFLMRYIYLHFFLQ